MIRQRFAIAETIISGTQRYADLWLLISQGSRRQHLPFKMPLLCVARLWPRNKTVAAINESSHVIVRFLFFRSARSSFQRIRIGSVNSSVAGANLRRVSASQLARAGRWATGACCNPNSSSASETTLTTSRSVRLSKPQALQECVYVPTTRADLCPEECSLKS